MRITSALLYYVKSVNHAVEPGRTVCRASYTSGDSPASAECIFTSNCAAVPVWTQSNGNSGPGGREPAGRSGGSALPIAPLK